MAADARLVAPLGDLGAGDLARAGGKGASLGELLRAGYPVPAGFVVTTAAYAAAAERSGLSSRLAAQARERATEVDAAAGAAIREALAAVDLADDLRAAIADAYRAIGGGPVAVRSSATAEDLPGAAFAGQQDTYLNVIGDDAVVDAVRRCWASLWTDRAVAYRRRRGVRGDRTRMAVVVQAMVDADTAGVMLTANPVTGARDELVVDASAGLGEAVVSGLVIPDRYVLDRRGTVRAFTAGTGGLVVRPAPAGGVTHDRAGTATPGRLPEHVIAELARLGADVAERFGRPQDIEWAVAGSRVWLLQARPLTAVPPPPLRLGRVRRATGRQIAEMLPLRPYPLDMSSWTTLGPGRMVERMLWEIAGLRLDFSAVLPERGGVVERLVPPAPRPTWRTLAAPLRNLGRIRRHDPAAWTDDPRFADYERRIRLLAAADPASLSWAELSRLPRRALDALQTVTDLRVDYLPAAATSLLRLRVTLRLLGLGGLFAELVAGAPTRTTDANRALAALAERVRADPAARARFERLDAAALAACVTRDAGLADLRAALDGFLAEYGHRETTSPLLLSSPTWSEDHGAVLGAVKALVGERAQPGGADRAGQALRRLLGHPLVRGTGSRGRVLRSVRAARAGVAFREDTHFHGTRGLPVARRALLETGRRLAAAGVLSDRDEVWHLRLEELEALPDPATVDAADAERLRRVVRARSSRRDELDGAPLIAPAALFPDVPGDADTLAVGTPAGGGRATGPVRVIRTPDEFGRLRGGEVLVCPYTNPAWTPLFQRAAAVVVDTGGAGSHAAIVAREYGIPAVMGTGAGSASMADGQLVTVDGDRGRVARAEPKRR